MAVASGSKGGLHAARRRWAAVVPAALVASALTVSPSMADEPDLATSTVLHVAVGGDRTGAGQNDVSGLDGVVLGAYQGTNPTPVDTCTSDGGTCSLIIPDTNVGGDNYNQRFWIRQISAPTGWYTNPTLRTGGSNATPANVDDYEFQTPGLTAREYQSDALLSSAGMNSGTEAASLGWWQQSRNNPELAPRCGIGRVMILTDWSSSVGVRPGYPTLISTLDQIVDAFAGTAASLSFVPFGYQRIDTSTAYFPVSSPNEVAAFKNLYAGWRSMGTQGTNWDAGLRAAAQTDPDLVIMLTDGNPTVWGAGTQAQGSANSNQLADVEAAIFAANALKNTGARVVALGVGDGVSATSGAEWNLRAVSGQTGFDGSNYLEADYFQTTDYEAAAEAFRQMAIASCEGTLTVVKQIVPPNGTIADAVVAGPGWQFTVSGDAIAGGSRTTETDQTGTVTFNLEADLPGETELQLSERQLTGYTLLPVNGQPDGPRAVCTAVGSGETRQVSNDPDDPDGVLLADIPVHESTTCTFYNQAPDEATSVQVDKRWVVNGEVFADGDQPSGLEASLNLGVEPRGAASSQVEDAQFGERYSRYAADSTNFIAADDVIIGETVTDGPYCTADPSRTTLHALADETSNPSRPFLRTDHKVNLSADPEWNHLVVTNYADCDSAPRWTLSKTSDPATGMVVERGGRVTYTVTATNLDPQSRFPLRNLTIVDDLTEVLGQADIDPSSIVVSSGTADFTDPELVWTVDALDSTATLTYQVVVHEDADEGATITNAVYGQPSGGDPEVPGTGGISPEECLPDEPCETTHYTPLPGTVDDYDLALRMWVGEAYRNQQLVHQLFPASTEPGPDYDEPYVGFDRLAYAVLPGDLMVHDIHLFNQGTGTAQVEQLVGYLPAEGLSLADPAAVAAIVPVDGPITNDHWSLAADGNLYYDPPDPIVIPPGGTARVPLTLEVGTTTVVDPAATYTTVDMYAEISQFSGSTEAGIAARIPVDDVDSLPDNANGEPTGSYKNHVINENAFAVVSGQRVFLPDADEDDHDGSHLRVVRQEVLPGEDPGGDPPTGSSPQETSYDLLARTGGTAWPVGVVALVVLMAGGAAIAWSRRMRSVGR